MITEIRKTDGFRGLLHLTVNWVCKAVSHDATRDTINHMLVEGGVIIAADGRRMHVSHAIDGLGITLTDGLYRVLKTGKTTWLDKIHLPPKYPDWRSVIPDVTTGHNAVHYCCRDMRHHYLPMLRAAEQATSGGVFNPEFLMDAAGDSRMERPYDMYVFGTKPDAPAVMYHGLGFAVVMPMRQDSYSLTISSL